MSLTVVSANKVSSNGHGDVTTGESTEVQVWKVCFNLPGANTIDARNASGVPIWGARLGSYNLYVIEKDAAMDDDDNTGLVWKVTVTYKTLSANGQQPKLNATSSKWNIIKNITPFPVEVPIQKDPRTGKMIVNCIGEPIKPSPTRVLYDYQLNISFSTATLDKTTIDACNEKTNPQTVNMPFGAGTLTFAADTLLFKCTPAQEAYDVDGSLTLGMNYQLLYRKDTWLAQYPNLSYNYKDGEGNIHAYLDAAGQPRPEPSYLDVDGFPLASGGTITIAGNGGDFPNGTNSGYWPMSQAGTLTWNALMAEITV